MDLLDFDFQGVTPDECHSENIKAAADCINVCPDLDVERIGDNVVARTTGHHATRLLVAGHLDTVPGDASAAVIEGDELRGVGACDMKGSLSVMLELASTQTPRS